VLIPKISFRNVDSTESLVAAINSKTAKLYQLFDRLGSCEVMVEAPHRSHHKGGHYHVRILLGVPGDEIVVGRDPVAADAHEDVNIAVRDAFDAARRQLLDYAQRRRGEVKHHDARP